MKLGVPMGSPVIDFQMSRWLASLGGGSLAVGVVLTALGCVLWWPFVMVGGALLLSAANVAKNNEPLGRRLEWHPKWVLALWFIYVLAGAVVEAVRIVPDLWDYAPPYEHPVSVAVLIVIGYPAMFVLALEAYVAGRRSRGGRWGGVAVALAVVVCLNEIPNAFTPMWHVPTDGAGVVHALFAAGYVLEVTIAVGAFVALEREKALAPRRE